MTQSKQLIAKLKARSIAKKKYIANRKHYYTDTIAFIRGFNDGWKAHKKYLKSKVSE